MNRSPLFCVTKQGTHKIITLCGVRFKVRSKSATRREMYRQIAQEVSGQQVRLFKRTLQSLLSSNVIHPSTFAPYKNCNQGKTVVLCGSGPSLTRYVPMEQALHCSLNRAFENPHIKFDYLFACDWNGIKASQEEFKRYPALKFCGSGMSNPVENIPESFIEDIHGKKFIVEQLWTDIIAELDFQPDISHNPLVIGNTVAIPAMQFLLWTNPAKIYIVGCDCAPTGHFCQLTAQYEQIYQKSIQNNCYPKQLLEWKALKKFAEAYYPKTEIISVNPVGLKGVFKDIFTD